MCVCVCVRGWLVGSWLGFYGLSAFVGYLMTNPFHSKKSVLFQTIHFSMSTQFNFQKHFDLQAIQFSQKVLIEKNPFGIIRGFVYTQINVKKFSLA